MESRLDPGAGRLVADTLLIDSYQTPGAESLLRLGRARHSDVSQARRLLWTESGTAALFIVSTGALAVLAHSSRTLSLSALAVTVVTYLIAGRVQYPVGSSWTAPTQLAFVPMLFVLPRPWVPLIVAACSVADRVPAVVDGRVALTRLVARVGDSFYALGPALVLVLFGAQVFSWGRWPVLALAFGAQVAFDAGAGLGRTWFAERVPPAVQLPMLWLYVTDACLSCVGLLVAGAAVDRPGLVLLALPLVGLLGMLARERRQRLEYSLALSTAYRDTSTLLAQSQTLTQTLEKQSEALSVTNEKLEQKARLLIEQNRDIEIKNDEIEFARRGLEEKAAQLALSSKYKSEFLANMSHELRTPLNSMLLTAMLERCGMKVVYAENGLEGIERLNQHRNTDIVLLDIMMPGMDGYETAQAIRAIPWFEQLPIISLTAKAMKRDREKAIAAGASDYITKPVDVDQLVSMMRAWLDPRP